MAARGSLMPRAPRSKKSGRRRYRSPALPRKMRRYSCPGGKNAIVLPRNSPGLQLLQRLRDEAHRFALAYHTRVHRKKSFASALDGVQGIGPKRKRALLRKFGSLRGIKNAALDELAAVPGMTRRTAEKLKEELG